MIRKLLHIVLFMSVITCLIASFSINVFAQSTETVNNPVMTPENKAKLEAYEKKLLLEMEEEGYSVSLFSTSAPTFEQYLADYNYNYNCYDFYKNKFNTPYRNYVEHRKDNLIYQGLLGAWRVATFDLSSEAEYSTKEIGFYETILFDVLYQGKDYENTTGQLRNITKSVQASSFKTVCDSLRKEGSSYGLSKLSTMSDEELSDLNDALQSCIELKEVFGAIGKIDKVLKYASTVEELIAKISKASAVTKQNNETAKILLAMKNKTTNGAFKEALSNMILVCSENTTEASIIDMFVSNETVSVMWEVRLKKVWGIVTEHLGVYGIAITGAQTLGKMLVNVWFSTEKNIEMYYSCCALYEFENILKNVMSTYESSYRSNKSDANSTMFNEAYKMLLQTHLLGIKASKDYVKITKEEGALNDLWNYLTDTNYEEYYEKLNDIQRSIELTIDFMSSVAYNSYIEEYGNDIMSVVGMDKVTENYTPEQANATYTEMNLLNSECGNFTISSDFTLTRDSYVYSDLKLTGGTLDLNGYTLVVAGNLTQNAGATINIGSGTLTVNGEVFVSGAINMEQGKLEVLGGVKFGSEFASDGIINVGEGILKIHGDCITTNIFSYPKGLINVEKGYVEILGMLNMRSSYDQSQVKMNDDEGNMLVHGNFYVRGAELTAGTLELKGSSISSGAYGIKTSGTHKTILSGEETQTISGSYITFNALDVKNEDVICNDYITVAKIENETINGTWKLKSTDLSKSNISEVNGALYCDDVSLGNLSNIHGDLYCNELSLEDNKLTVSGSLNVLTHNELHLNTGTLTVNGEVFVSGAINMEQGKLEVLGGVKFGSEFASDGIINVGEGILKIHGDCITTNIFSYPKGLINVEKGYVEILGMLNMRSSYDQSQVKMNDDEGNMLVHGNFYVRGAELTAGTLELKGSSISSGTYGIKASGTHKIILSGEGTQTISENYITFNVLVNKNPNAVFKNTDYKYLFTEIPYTLTIKSNKDDSTVYDFVDSTKETLILSQLQNVNKEDSEGYIFKGWFADEEFTIPLKDSIIQSDMTVYAKYVNQLMKFENVEYFSDSNKLSVSVTVDDELQQKNGIALVAVYNADTLVDIYYTGTIETINHTFTNLPKVKENYTVKAFYWLNFESLKPLCESVSTTVQ